MEQGREKDWRYYAECLKEDPELFFPVGSETSAPVRAQIELAKAVCDRCIVREECLNWALENGIEHGVWGGKSEEELKRLKRRAARRGR